MTEYEQLVNALQAPFPQGSVIHKGNRAFIPVQTYMVRLEEVAHDKWGWAIIDAPQIDLTSRVVTLRGELSILNAKRQGIGIASIKDGEPSSIKNAILIAESEALRDACDKYLMGWKDLAPFKEWGENPGISPFLFGQTSSLYIEGFDSQLHSAPPNTNEKCLRCKALLTNEDILMLRINNVKHFYCREHIPPQFIKK